MAGNPKNNMAKSQMSLNFELCLFHRQNNIESLDSSAFIFVKKMKKKFQDNNVNSLLFLSFKVEEIICATQKQVMFLSNQQQIKIMFASGQKWLEMKFSPEN